MTYQRIKTGALGESLAVKFLLSKGYEVIETNVRLLKLGEIDIVAKEKETIVFVEVKTRRSLDFGLPQEAVTYKKQEKIKRCAYAYLKKINKANSFFRFDVIAIQMGKENNENKVEHIINAF